MSVSEDGELQELVKQTLEKSGSIAKIRAELRAGVFLALEENGCFEKLNTPNNKLQNFSKTKDGVLLLCLVREFLEYFGLSFTVSVLNPELASYGISCDCYDRSKLSDQLEVSASSEENDGPLLSQMLRIIRNIQHEGKLRKSGTNDFENMNNRTCKSSETSTEYLPLHDPSNEKHSIPKYKQDVGKSESKLLLENPSSDNKYTTNVEEQDRERSKHNLSSLGDLPPILSPFGLKSNIGFSAFKQIDMLKAALQDTIASNEELSNSVISDDEIINTEDKSDIKQTESIEEESNITVNQNSNSL